MSSSFRRACSAKAFAVALTLAVPAVVGPLVRVGAAAGDAAAISEPDAPALSFREFFKMPVGPRGLEPTDKLLRLRDQRVRVQGYMVREEEPLPGLFLLTSMPVALAELADGPADYLPAGTLFVHGGGEGKERIIGYRPGIWTLSGILRLGAWLEPNGRVSYVRLILDGLQSVETPRKDASAPTHGHRH